MSTFSQQYEKAKTEPDNPYSINDAGCYLDGARGIYLIDGLVSFAEDHGFKLNETEEQFYADHDYSLVDYEWNGETEDRIDDYMNDNYGVDGAYWGRNENGDWGLWQIEE